MSDEHDDNEIKVAVTFPLGKEGPYQKELPGTTTVGTVLEAAMKHFEAKPEPNIVYYLTAKGERQDDAKTIAQVAGGDEEEVSFRLVKEITQG